MMLPRLFPIVFLLLPGAVRAEWIKARLGSFETISDNGRKTAIQGLNQFEQLRFVLGTAMGKPDLKLDPPLRILVFKDAKELAAQGCKGFIDGRDRTMACTTAEGQLPPAFQRELTRRLLAANFTALPPAIAQALEAFFSTVKSEGVRVTWGDPPAASERTRAWAELHFLLTNAVYAGRAHIYLHNLSSGMAQSAAFRSLGEDPGKLNAEIDRYFAAGVFAATQAPNRPLNPDRDFATTALTSDEGQLARADLLNTASYGLYQTLLTNKKQMVAANEGLAILALRAGDKSLARTHMEAARQAGSKNAVALTLYASIEPDDQRAIDILHEALSADDKYAAAHWALGERVPPGGRRLAEWKQAVALAPGNYEWLARYAQHAQDNKQFAEAGRAWLAASQAAPNQKLREQYFAARENINQLRLDDEEAERRRIAAEKAAEIDRLKSQARKELADIEARARRKTSDKDAAAPVVDWDDVHASATVEGTITRADCVGKELRIDVRDGGGKLLRFRAATTQQLEITGGNGTLACGPQKRAALVGYRPLKDDKTWTGDLYTIELR